MKTLTIASSTSSTVRSTIPLLLLGALGCAAGSRLTSEAEELRRLETTKIVTNFERNNDWRTGLPTPGAGELRELPVAVVRRTVEVRDATGALLARSEPQRIERGDSLVRVRGTGAGPELVVTRNPVVGDRVLVSKLDHAARLILDHADPDLRSAGLPTEFATFATCLIEPSLLARARAVDADVETAFGLEFRRSSVAMPTEEGSVDLWWNDAWQLPLRVEERFPDGVCRTTRFTLLDRGGPQPLDPRPILERRYARLDLCDWRERLCACTDGSRRSR